MGTGVVDRKVLPVHVEDGDLLSADLDPLSTPKGDVLSLRYLHKSRHGSPPSSLSIDGSGVMFAYRPRCRICFARKPETATRSSNAVATSSHIVKFIVTVWADNG